MKKKIPFNLLVFLLYLCFAILLTYPLVFHFRTHLPGPPTPSDQLTTVWFFWWFKKALLEGRQVFFSDYIFYPNGVHLMPQAIDFIPVALAFPLSFFFSFIVIYNLIFLFFFALAGYFTYLLVDYLVHDRKAAFISGLLFAFMPYLLRLEISHLDLLPTFVLPLYLLYLLKTTQAPTIKNRLILGLCFLLGSVAYFYFFIYLGLLTLVYLVWLWRSQTHPLLPLLKKLFLPLGLALLLQLPLFIVDFRKLPFFNEVIQGGFKGAEIYSVFFYQYFKPFSSFFLGFIPFLGLLILVRFKIYRQKEVKFWLISFVLFFILALGPVLHFFKSPTKVILLYWLFQWIPFLSTLRTPCRFFVPLMLSLTVLTGYALSFIFQKLKERKEIVWWFILPLLCITVILDFERVPIPLFPLEVDPFYQRLAQQKKEFAILEIPFGFSDGFRGRGDEWVEPLYFQTIHQKKILNGRVARMNKNQLNVYTQNSLFNTILLFEEKKEVDAQTREKAKKQAPEILQDLNIRYILLHQKYFHSPLSEFIQNLGFKKIYQDNKLKVYEVQ